MLLAGVIVIVIIIVGSFLLKPLLSKFGQAKGYAVAQEQIRGEMIGRLQSIASQVGGTIVDGPALQTAQGRVTLVASAAPKSLAIDVAKFTAPLGVKAQLTLIPVEDAAKALVTKHLHSVTPDDATVAAQYRLLAPDDAFRRK